MKLADLQAELATRGVRELPKGKTALTSCLQRLDAAVEAETTGAKEGEQVRVLAEINAENAAGAAAIIAEQERKKNAKKAAKREQRETAGEASRAAAAAAVGDAGGVAGAPEPGGEGGAKSKRQGKKKTPLEPPGKRKRATQCPTTVAYSSVFGSI